MWILLLSNITQHLSIFTNESDIKSSGGDAAREIIILHHRKTTSTVFYGAGGEDGNEAVIMVSVGLFSGLGSSSNQAGVYFILGQQRFDGEIQQRTEIMMDVVSSANLIDIKTPPLSKSFHLNYDVFTNANLHSSSQIPPTSTSYWIIFIILPFSLSLAIIFSSLVHTTQFQL